MILSEFYAVFFKKLDHEICIVKSATNIHPIFPAIAGGTELTLETTTNSDEKLMSLDNDKRFRYILTAV